MPSGMGGAVVAAKAGASAAIAAAHNGAAGHGKSLQTVAAEKAQSKAAKLGAQVAILQGAKKNPLEAILLKDRAGKVIKPGQDWAAAQEKAAQDKAQWAPSAPAAATGGQGAFSKLDEASKAVSKPITAAKLRLGALAEKMTKSSLAGDHQAAQDIAAEYRAVEQELAGLKVARLSATRSAIFGKGVFQSGAGAAVARSAGPLGGVISGVTAAASDYSAVKSGKLRKEDAGADVIVKTGTGALSTMAGAAAGAEAGAAVGVWFGGVGAIPGAVVGAGAGIAAAALSSKAMDETIVRPLTKGIADGIRDVEKGDAGRFVRDVGHGVVGAAGNVAGRAVDLAGDVVGGTVKGVGDHLRGFAHGAQDLAKGNVRAAVADVAKGEFDGTTDIAKGLWSGAKDFLRHEE